ncbi:MAG: EamA family transporter [Rhizobiales bacterium]|nr:EamA family transporter [Hyphomicrobiales bacterium]
MPEHSSSTLPDVAKSDATKSDATKSDATQARALLIVLCIGWGTTWVTMKMALDEIPPFSMRLTTLSLGAVVLTSFARFQGRTLAITSPRMWLHICVASLFNIVGFSLFTPFAQLAADTSRVAIMVYTMPIWAAMLALPILGERLTATRLTALALCIAGVVILVAPLAGSGVPLGIMLALGGAVSWAAGTVYLKWARIDGDPMAITIWQLVFAIAVMAICVPAFEGTLHLDAGARSLFGLIYSGIIGSGLCYFLWFGTVRRLPASTAALGILASPVIGVISSMIVLGERPTWYDGIGFALMLSASAIVVLRPEGAVQTGR